MAEERLFFSLPDQPIDKKSKRNTVAVVMSKSAPEDSPLSPGRPQAAPPPRPTALTPIASSPPVPGIERPRARVALAPPQVVTPKKVAPAVVYVHPSTLIPFFLDISSWPGVGYGGGLQVSNFVPVLFLRCPLLMMFQGKKTTVHPMRIFHPMKTMQY